MTWSKNPIANFANLWKHREIHNEEYPGLCSSDKESKRELRKPLETSRNKTYSTCTLLVPFWLSQRVKFLVLKLLDEVPGATIYWIMYLSRSACLRVPSLGTPWQGTWCYHILNTVSGTFRLSQRVKFIILELLDEVPGATIYWILYLARSACPRESSSFYWNSLTRYLVPAYTEYCTLRVLPVPESQVPRLGTLWRGTWCHGSSHHPQIINIKFITISEAQFLFRLLMLLQPPLWDRSGGNNKRRLKLLDLIF